MVDRMSETNRIAQAEVDFRQYIQNRLPPTSVSPMFSRRKLAEVDWRKSPSYIPPYIKGEGRGL